MKLLCQNQKCIKTFDPTKLAEHDFYYVRKCDKCLDYMCSQKCFEEHYCNFTEKEIQEIGRYYMFSIQLKKEEEK